MAKNLARVGCGRDDRNKGAATTTPAKDGQNRHP